MVQIDTPAAPRAIGPYSQAVVLDGWVFVSGQIPLRPENGELVAGPAAAQAERVLLNLQAVLAAAGTDLGRVVKATIYLKDLADFQAVNQVYERFFKPPYPARATVQVAALPRGAALEIEVVARV